MLYLYILSLTYVYIRIWILSNFMLFCYGNLCRKLKRSTLHIGGWRTWRCCFTLRWPVWRAARDRFRSGFSTRNMRFLHCIVFTRICIALLEHPLSHFSRYAAIWLMLMLQVDLVELFRRQSKWRVQQLLGEMELSINPQAGKHVRWWGMYSNSNVIQYSNNCFIFHFEIISTREYQSQHKVLPDDGTL